MLTATLSAATTEATNIDFEVERTAGRAGNYDQGIDDAFTPAAPDLTCTVASGGTQCNVQYVSNGTGTDLITGWIDHDGLNGNQPGGQTELDPTEGRDEGSQPGTTPEADLTDVVQKDWAPGTAAKLDCDDQSGDDTESNPQNGASREIYRCTAQDAVGNPVPGVGIDAENLTTTVNDPDDSATGPGGNGADRSGFDNNATFEDALNVGLGLTDCAIDGTDGNGECNFPVNDGDNELGSATICFWADNNSTDEFDPAGANEDGADCDNEAVGEAENNDITDTVTKTWVANAATFIDCNPDTASNPTGTQHNVQCQVFDQFSQALGAGQLVDVEFLAGSVNDPQNDGTTAPPDLNNVATDGNGIATIQWSGANIGTDSVCAWIDTDNDTQLDGNCGEAVTDTTNDDANGGTATEADDSTDVFQKTWTSGQDLRINCTPEVASNSLPTDPNHTITCVVTDQSAAPVQGQTVKVEASGANDPDAAASNASPDFTCQTDGAGQCQINDNAGPAFNTGTTTYRAWVGTTPDDAEGRDEGVTPGSTQEPDNTDVVEKRWTGAGTNLAVTPQQDSAAVGTCNVFTATLTDAQGAGVAGATLDVRQTDNAFGGAAGDESDPNFCAAPAGSGPNPTNSTEYDSGNADGQSAAETNVVTDANGQVTFGVSVTANANATGLVNLLVWCEDSECTNGANDNVPQNNEPQASAQKTWTAGGDDAVESVDAEPETARNPNGTTHTFTVTLRNSASGGDTVAGVTPVSKVTAGPNAGMTPACTASNNSGQSVCQYTDPGNTPAGTDTIETWINQSAGSGGGTTNRDAGEPFDEITKEWFTPPTGLNINATCDDTNGPSGDPTADDDRSNYFGGFGDTNADCVNPLTANTETFTALVTNPNNTGDPSDDTPVAGIQVRWFINQRQPQDIGFTPPGGAATTVTCDTDATGRCSVTVTNPTPEHGDGVIVSATISGQQQQGSFGNSDDAVGKLWARAGEPADIALTPQRQINKTGTSHTVTATVSDAFGSPVAGANVDFNVNGRNTATGNDKTTDASGKATFTYNDAGNVNTDGTDNISAWVDNVTENDTDDTPGAGSPDSDEPDDTAVKDWRVTPPTVSQVKIDMIPGNNANAPHCPSSPGQTAQYDASANNPIGVTHALCGVAFDTTNAPVPTGTMTFSIVSGPGQFTNAGGTANLGSTVTVPVDQAGDFHAFLKSTQSGQTVVKAEKDGKSDQGTKNWTANPARNIDCEPETGTNPPGEEHLVTCTATDAVGNPVPGWTVWGSETGPGRFKAAGVANCTSTNCPITTNGSGEAEFVLENTTNEEGLQTATFELDNGFGTRASGDPAVNECERPVNNPSGAPAGNCTDQVTKTWQQDAPQCSDDLDNDGDGFIDFDGGPAGEDNDPSCDSLDEDSEAPFDTPPPTKVKHPRKVKIAEFDHFDKNTLIIRGWLKTTDGYNQCSKSKPIKVQILTNSGWVTKKSDTTSNKDPNGDSKYNWKVAVSHDTNDVRKYRAIAPKVKIPDNTANETHVCKQAESDVKKHKPGHG